MSEHLVLVHLVVLLLEVIVVVILILVGRVLLGSLSKVDDLSARATTDNVLQRDGALGVVTILIILVGYRL